MNDQDRPQAMMERSHLAWDDFVKGNSEAAKALFSRQADVSLGNPFGPFVRGWEEAAKTMERAASLYREGEVESFEAIASYVTSDLACFVEVERYRAKVGGNSETTAVALRVTSVLRRENGEWKIVHRHADPITTARSADSVIQRT